MQSRAGFSTQGQFTIPTTSANKVFTVSLTKDPSLNTPDNSSPVGAENSQWFVYQAYGSKINKLSIMNLSNQPLIFSFTNGERWSTLPLGATWEEDDLSISFFKVKTTAATAVAFQFTAKGM